MLDQTRLIEHQFDDLAQCHAWRLLAHHIDHGHKACQLGACFAGCGANGIVQRAPQTFGGILQLLHTASANAARREIHNSQETGVVVGIF